LTNPLHLLAWNWFFNFSFKLHFALNNRAMMCLLNNEFLF
jgi:hypothetical protein